MAVFILLSQMDIARPSNGRQKRIRCTAYVAGGLAAVTLMPVGLSPVSSRPCPASSAPRVWFDTVRRGGGAPSSPKISAGLATTQGRVRRDPDAELGLQEIDDPPPICSDGT
jgi:hypothetical protein